MNNQTELHPVELLILAVLLVVEALAVVLVPLAALVLTLASYGRPWPPRRGSATSPSTTAPAVTVVAPTAPAAVVATAPAPPAVQQPQPAPWTPPVLEVLERCTVTELRRLARAQGLPRSLSRAGRRAELVPALAGAAIGVW